MPFALTSTAAKAPPPLPDWISKHPEWTQVVLAQVSVGAQGGGADPCPGTSFEAQGGFQLHNTKNPSP